MIDLKYFFFSKKEKEKENKTMDNFIFFLIRFTALRH